MTEPLSPNRGQNPGPRGHAVAGTGQDAHGYAQNPYQSTGQFPGSGGQWQNAGPWGPAGGAPGPGVAASKKRNVLGIVALAVAVIGTIFACIPGALIVGWVLLPIAFILGLVALFVSGAGKRSAIAAVIVSIVGTIVGVGVFVTVVDDAFGDAFDSEVAVSNSGQGSAEGVGAAVLQESGDAATGTRENPANIGDVLTSTEWEVVVNGVNRNATAEVLAENPYNDAPPQGSQYVLVDISATYLGSDSGWLGSIGAAWVTESGNVIRSFDYAAVVPEPLDGELYEGASKRGNKVLAVPESDGGLLRIDLGFVDEVFVNVG